MTFDDLTPAAPRPLRAPPQLSHRLDGSGFKTIGII